MCRCPSGLRTVGTCSHIAGVIMYLGYNRHQEVLQLKIKELEDVLNTNEIEEIDKN
jgi:hypothetical protein